MSRNLVPAIFATVLLGGTTYADVPSVAVDIAPVHSLVARVMEGVGTPDLIIQLGASPHEYSLRPSEARALQQADVVFWMGEGLTPWMENAIDTLSDGAAVTALLEIEDTELLDIREDALFEAHAHHDDENDHADDADTHHKDDHAKSEDDHHDHDTHAEDAHHEDEHNHEDHANDDDHAGHDHGVHDPHAWLSPDNARTWLNVIAAELSAVDPENAGAYFANAAEGRAEIEALKAEVSEMLDPIRGRQFIVFHDAYQYFETAFDVPIAGAISISDASDPSPARVAEIQSRVRDEGIDCVLSEPQYNASLVATVLDGTEASTGVTDPHGAHLEAGSSLYPQLIKDLAGALVACVE